MILKGPYTAVVDEIEVGTARLELEGPDGELSDLYVEVESLPTGGRHESAVLNVVVEDKTLAMAEYDKAETERRRESMRDRFDPYSCSPVER